MDDKSIEYINDVTADCGCLELGDYLYDMQGNPTHLANEECTN